MVNTKRIEISKVEKVNSNIIHNGKLFNGVLYDKFENGNLKFEFDVVDGLKHGLYNEYDVNGNLLNQRQYNNDFQHGFDVLLKPSGKKIKESKFLNGKHIKSIHYDINDKEISGLNWFDGIILENNIKIRKYYLTNRYVFSPKLLWLDNISSSIVSKLFSFLYLNCNFEESSGGGGIKSMELKINSKKTKEIEFKDLDSKNYVEESLLKFKKNFKENYELIFSDKSIDDVKELSKYKMLIYPWVLPSSIEKNTHYSKLFDKKYLSIYKGFNKECKNWIVMDKSVKPIGIVFESDLKEDCIKWIEKWDNK